MATVLLTGGRAPATLDLARVFCAAGHRVVVAESLRWPLTRLSRAVSRHYTVPPPRLAGTAFVTALLDIVRRECVDLVVPTCEEVFHMAARAETLRVHTRVFAAPFTQLRRLHSKAAFIQAVRDAGLAAPETIVATAVDALGVGIDRLANGAVVKPEYSRFATEVVVKPAGRNDVSHLEVSPTRPWVVQAFVSGRPVCTYAVAHGGRLTAYAAYGVSYTAGQASAILFEADASADVEQWVRTFVAAEAFTGQIAFDLVVDGDGRVWPIECNPRATSGVHLFAGHPSLAAAFFDPDGDVVRGRPDGVAGLLVPLLLYGPRQVSRTGGWMRFLRTVIRSRDVVWRVADPLPALSQPAALAELSLLARRCGRPLLAASTVDIEYNGEDLCASS